MLSTPKALTVCELGSMLASCLDFVCALDCRLYSLGFSGLGLKVAALVAFIFWRSEAI